MPFMPPDFSAQLQGRAMPSMPKVQPSLMERLQMGLLGPQPSYGGLLSEEDQKAARQQGLLALGAQLMSAGGESPTRVSFGQALGPALMAGQQAQGAAGQDMLQAMLLKTKLQKPAGEKPSTVAEYEYAKANGYQGSFEEWKRVASSQPANPAAIQEYEYWNKLPTQQEKDAYLTIKRSMQPYQLGEVGGGKVVFNRATGQYEQASSAGQEAAGAGQIAAGTAAGKVSGETTATAQFDLPRVEDNAKQMLSLLDKLKSHPGRKIATGGTAVLQTEKVPGTAARDFSALVAQVGGKQFLEAYNTLKGGGQITEVEGKKAETAISTIQDRGQSEEAYLQAIEDLREVVNAGVERARKKTGASSPASSRSRQDILKQYGL
jgi:hypothetical protein